MWSLRMCVVLLTAAAAELRCTHPQCVAGSVSDRKHSFTVQDHQIYITHEDSGRLTVDCDEWQALDSPAMPSFISVVRAKFVELSGCPPPAAGSFADTLNALNVTLLHSNGTFGVLSLAMMPSEPSLSAQHFTGLEQLEELEISSTDSPQHAPTTGFLSRLRNLHSLELTNVLLPAGELSDPPPKLQSLMLFEAGLEQLPTALLALSSLQYLVVISESTPINAKFLLPPPVLYTLLLDSTNTTMRLDEFPAVEDLTLYKWTERRPAALMRCDVLQSLEVYDLAAEELPERWVATCPRLDVLTLRGMHNLASLPSKLLENANTLTKLTLSYGILKTLPEGLLDGVPNLVELYLDSQHLHTIPSDAFLGSRSLYRLELNNNRLEKKSLAALALLTHLNVLDLSDNSRLSNLCDNNDYSPLLHLTQLRTLDLSGTNITRICRDWRENLTFLWTLELRNTNISELQYMDFQYTRDEMVANAQVRLEGAPIKSVRFTEDDYKRSLTAPPSDAWIHLDARLDCDCRMYWTRLVAEHARRTFRVLPLLCTGNRNFSDETADNVCVPKSTALSGKNNKASAKIPIRRTLPLLF